MPSKVRRKPCAAVRGRKNLRRSARPAVPRRSAATPDLQALPGPKSIVRRELPNGAVVLARENFLSPSVVVLGALWAGGLDEREEKAGLAALTSMCLMRGAGKRSFHQIYNLLESAGATLSFGSGMHTTSFYCRCLAEDLPLALELAADALRRPSFPNDQFERLRGEYLTRLSVREQDTGERAYMAFAELAYAGHPYAHDKEGSPKTIRGITRRDLQDFHARWYGPRKMIFAVAGAAHSGKAIHLIEKYFGDWKNPLQTGRPALPPAPRAAKGVERRIPLSGKTQADLVLGIPGPARAAPDYLPAMLGNNILGVFGMYGRIGDAVREAEGLAYYSMSTLSGGVGPGPWMVLAGVNPDNVPRAVELIRREISRFTGSKVARGELADSQASIIGRIPLQMESNEGMAGSLMNIEMFNLGLDYYQRFPGLIRAITADQILEAARHYLHPERMVLAVAGPPEGG
ncbi:MAG: insulinase family protein [Anaerolineales bacterium]|nr:insulinase family protein [Anaerolineales bacterium]